MLGRTENIHRLWRPLHYYRFHDSNTSRDRTKLLANLARMFDFLIDEVPWSDEERLLVHERARSFARYETDPPPASLEQLLRLWPTVRSQGAARVADSAPASLERPWRDVLASFRHRWLSPQDAHEIAAGRRRSGNASRRTATRRVKGSIRQLVGRTIYHAVDHPSFIAR